VDRRELRGAGVRRTQPLTRRGGMKVLFERGTPVPLRRHLGEHEVAGRL
jgi:hypothetical protein